MERAAWLKERRRQSELRFEAVCTKENDKKRNEITKTQRAFVEELLGMGVGPGTILDAACGNGKYWPLILERGYHILGVDQSQRMLAQAQERYPDVPVQRTMLQELAFVEEFEGALCIDAIENIFPEDWSLVMRNLYQALKDGGYLYLTVPLIDEKKLQVAFSQGRRQGLPLMPGEYIVSGRYYYYPSVDQARAWTREAGFVIVGEAEGDGAYHVLGRRG